MTRDGEGHNASSYSGLMISEYAKAVGWASRMAPYSEPGIVEARLLNHFTALGCMSFDIAGHPRGEGSQVEQDSRERLLAQTGW